MMRDLMAALVASSLLMSCTRAEVTHISESKGLRVSKETYQVLKLQFHLDPYECLHLIQIGWQWPPR